MDVVLLDELFRVGSDQLRLLGFFDFALSERHRVTVESTELVSNYDVWRKGLPRQLADEVELARVTSESKIQLQPSEWQVTVGAFNASSWARLKLTVRDALDLLGKPCRILLENGISDGRFLRAMMTKAEREFLEQREDCEWVIFEGCGGIGELPKRVKWAHQRADRLLRCAALFDSDTTEPAMGPTESAAAFEDRISSQSRSALEACRNEGGASVHDLLYHVLRRRCIENYMPIETLRKRMSGDKLGTVKALGRLDDRERHVFDMKACFGKDVAELFAQVTQEELQGDGGWDELRPFVLNLLKRIR